LANKFRSVGDAGSHCRNWDPGVSGAQMGLRGGKRCRRLLPVVEDADDVVTVDVDAAEMRKALPA
jgi:hypothetical protein